MSFFMSPVGMTIFLGETLTSRIKDPVKKAARAISSMDGLTNSAYLAGVLVPLIALGVPLSPTALGPGIALFNAPPVFTEEHNLHHILSTGDFIIATVIGAAVAISLTYYVTIKYYQQISALEIKYIPNEAIVGMYIGIEIIID